MSFINLYYKRTAGTLKACYVCRKPTQTVLATIDIVDFLYTCPGHLCDPGFATLEEEKRVSTEEIARVKLEWEEKQKLKGKEKDKDKEEEKDSSTKDNKNTEQQTDKDADKLKKETSPKSSSTTPSTPTHERYVLHRNFYTMRQNEHRRRNQAMREIIQAKELVPRLPSAPTGGPRLNSPST